MGLLGQDNYSISYHYLQTGVLLFMALYPLQFHHVLIAIFDDLFVGKYIQRVMYSCF